MKNKGFTVVELITSFALTMIISLFLFEVLIDVKDIFIETSIKTKIQEKLGVISKNIKSSINEGSSYECEDTSCHYLRNGNPNLITINTSDNSITIKDQKYKMPEDVKIKNASIENITSDGENYCIKIKMSLSHKSLSEDYEYKAVYYYHIEINS